MVHMQWFFIELLMSKQRGLCLLWKVLCNQSSWTYSHVMLWFLEINVYWSLFLCVGALLSLICLWLVQHVIALPKVIQGPCLANRNVAYMWTCHKYHVMDALLVTLAIMLKHHLVTHSIC